MPQVSMSPAIRTWKKTPDKTNGVALPVGFFATFPDLERSSERRANRNWNIRVRIFSPDVELSQRLSRARKRSHD